MITEKEIKERELIEEKARKKGWIVKGLATEKPIDYYLTRQDYKRWTELVKKLQSFRLDSEETIQEYRKRVEDNIEISKDDFMILVKIVRDWDEQHQDYHESKLRFEDFFKKKLKKEKNAKNKNKRKTNII